MHKDTEAQSEPARQVLRRLEQKWQSRSTQCASGLWQTDLAGLSLPVQHRSFWNAIELDPRARSACYDEWHSLILLAEFPVSFSYPSDCVNEVLSW